MIEKKGCRAEVIRGAVFDMDGLMFDTEAMMNRGWQKAGKKFGIVIPESFILSLMGMIEQNIKNEFLQKFGSGFPYDELRKFQLACVEKEVEEFGVPLKAGLLDLLDFLKENAISAAVATSTERARAEKLLEKAGITHFFDSVICGDMVERGKPDPDIYLKSAGALRLKPEECIGLEDSKNGIIAVQRSGMTAVLIPDLLEPDTVMKQAADVQLQDLSQVIAYIRQRNSR